MADTKRILAVDDEPDCLEFVKAILELEGFDIITAHNGEEGLKKAIDEHPDLIILDVQMPKKDGFRVFHEIKQDEKTKDIPVVMLTGIRDKVGMGFSVQEMEEFMGARPAEYIEKPIDPNKLKEAVKKIFKME